MSFNEVSWSQSNMYLGVQCGLDVDKWKLVKPSGPIAKKPCLATSFGFPLGRQFHNNFAIESGTIGNITIKVMVFYR